MSVTWLYHSDACICRLVDSSPKNKMSTSLARLHVILSSVTCCFCGEHKGRCLGAGLFWTPLTPTTWEWANYDRFLLLGWTISLRTVKLKSWNILGICSFWPCSQKQRFLTKRCGFFTAVKMTLIDSLLYTAKGYVKVCQQTWLTMVYFFFFSFRNPE